MRNRQVEIGAVLAPQERQVLPASALPTSARSVLDGCEDEGILIAETNDDAPAGRLWVNHAAPFRRGFPPPLTGAWNRIHKGPGMRAREVVGPS